MGQVAGRLLAALLLLSAVFGIGLGVYVLLAEAVVMSAFGLPVEVRGADKAVLAAFCFAPAAVLGRVAWSIRRGLRAEPSAAPDRRAR